jgi:hypothetical protein
MRAGEPSAPVQGAKALAVGGILAGAAGSRHGGRAVTAGSLGALAIQLGGVIASGARRT